MSERFSFVDMKYESAGGMIVVKWSQAENGSYRLFVKVPFNTVAYVELPWNKEEMVLEAGEYQWKM